MRNRVSRKTLGIKSHDTGKLSSSFGVETEACVSLREAVRAVQALFLNYLLSPVIN